MIKYTSPVLIVALMLFSLFFWFSCAGRIQFEQAESAMEKGDWDHAVTYYLNAISKKPGNVEYRLSLSKALISASNFHLQKGEKFFQRDNLKFALVEFNKALEFNPDNNHARLKKFETLKKMEDIRKARTKKTDIEKNKNRSEKKQIKSPKIDFKDKPYSFKFQHQDLKNILRGFRKGSGVDFLYDEGVKTKKISVYMENVGFMEALNKILIQARMFYKVLDPKTILIIPDTPAKRKDYDELVMRHFFLSNALPEDIVKIIQKMAGIRVFEINKNLNSITVRDIPEKIEIVEKIIRIHDKPRGELFIDLEIIEVNRNKTREYGIELSDYSITEMYMPEQPTAESTSNIRLNRIPHTDWSDYLLTLPSVNYRLMKYDTDSKIKAKPQLRVLDQEQVKVSLGDKVPIPSTSFVPQYGTGVNNQPITSFQMQDIGINIDLKPRIHHDGLITLEMKFELTFITNPGTDRLPPTIGNRSVETIIKLRDNETSVMAGLLRDQERKSIQGFPFLSDIPVLGEIFSSNKKDIEQTDIILLLTPRIIRFPEIREGDLDNYWVGTEKRLGLRESPPRLEIDKEEPKEPEKKGPKFSSIPESKPEPRIPTARIIRKPEKGKSDQGTLAGSQNKSGSLSLPDKNEKESQPKPEVKSNSLEETVHLDLLASQGKLKVGEPGSIILQVTGKTQARVLKTELAFDPDLVEVTAVKQGEIFSRGKVRGHFFKSINNKKGTIKINITLENTTSFTGTHIATVEVRAKRPGTVVIKPATFMALTAGMKPIEVTFSEVQLEAGAGKVKE